VTYLLEFLDDPEKFLAVAGPWLESEPVRNTVVASVTARLVRDGVPADPPAPFWWLVVRDEAGLVVGAGMRTAPVPPYPPYLLAMPAEAAVGLAGLLDARGERIEAINGALPAAEVFARETARLVGARVETGEQLRLYELGTLLSPPVPVGRLRAATTDDLDQVQEWFDAFSADAAEQAGQERPHPAPIEHRETTANRIERDQVWIWEDASGDPVHVTAFNPPSFGVARVGPVYTPREHRGHGYAAATVAEVSALLFGRGNRVCLFADVANPTSSAIYERLGFRPVVDMANLLLARQDGSGEPTST
jgi:RimJ/RimL family protein N-acetyltransferase